VVGRRIVGGLPEGRHRILRRWWGETRAGWDATAAESFTAQLREPDRVRASVLLYRNFLTRDMRAVLTGRHRRAGLEVPTLLVVGAEDNIIRPNQFAGSRRYAPSMATELVPGVGHFVVDEAPHLVRERARAFFADPRKEIVARREGPSGTRR
jgi:pimeloyl-ACP methyl ester carboxylesterase